MIVDAWRLAVGTLTAFPVRPPRHLDSGVCARAVLLAPFAVLPLGLLVAAVVAAGRWLGVPDLAVGLAAVGALALGSRAFHLDGLADTADGLTSSYRPERVLEVMKSGNTGPAGAAALVVVLGIQGSCLADLTRTPSGPLLAGLLVCLSRWGFAGACLRGVRVVSGSSLGRSYAECLRWPVVAGLVVVSAAASGAVLLADGVGWWAGPLGVLVATLLLAALTRRALRRLGGVNGDIFGASIELTLTVLLVAAASAQ